MSGFVMTPDKLAIAIKMNTSDYEPAGAQIKIGVNWLINGGNVK